MKKLFILALLAVLASCKKDDLKPSIDPKDLQGFAQMGNNIFSVDSIPSVNNYDGLVHPKVGEGKR